MKRVHAALGAAALFLTAGLCGTVGAQPADAAGMPVFDATNYAENLVQAARSLEQINNQVKSLENEESMLRGMATNLRRIDFPQLERMAAAMRRMDVLMGKAKAIGFKVDGLDERLRKLFPGAVARALDSDERVADARARL
ncbi:MAG: P-type conjugative transfer protein TrbJ, partial [Bacillota bacterium]